MDWREKVMSPRGDDLSAPASAGAARRGDVKAKKFSAMKNLLLMPRKGKKAEATTTRSKSEMSAKSRRRQFVASTVGAKELQNEENSAYGHTNGTQFNAQLAAASRSSQSIKSSFTGNNNNNSNNYSNDYRLAASQRAYERQASFQTVPSSGYSSQSVATSYSNNNPQLPTNVPPPDGDDDDDDLQFVARQPAVAASLEVRSMGGQTPRNHRRQTMRVAAPMVPMMPMMIDDENDNSDHNDDDGEQLTRQRNFHALAVEAVAANRRSSSLHHGGQDLPSCGHFLIDDASGRYQVAAGGVVGDESDDDEGAVASSQQSSPNESVSRRLSSNFRRRQMARECADSDAASDFHLRHNYNHNNHHHHYQHHPHQQHHSMRNLAQLNQQQQQQQFVGTEEQGGHLVAAAAAASANRKLAANQASRFNGAREYQHQSAQFRFNGRQKSQSQWPLQSQLQQSQLQSQANSYRSIKHQILANPPSQGQLIRPLHYANSVYYQFTSNNNSNNLLQVPSSDHQQYQSFLNNNNNNLHLNHHQHHRQLQQHSSAAIQEGDCGGPKILGQQQLNHLLADQQLDSYTQTSGDLQLQPLPPIGSGTWTSKQAHLSLQQLAAAETMQSPNDSRQQLAPSPNLHRKSHQHQHQQQHNLTHQKHTKRKVVANVQAVASSKQSKLSGRPTSGGSNGGGKLQPSTLSCCGKLAKLLMLISNTLFWSAGIALGAWGIVALVDDHKNNLSQLLVFEPNSRMSLFQLLSWSFITLGCAAILVGFCGCSAVFKNNRWILGLYIFLILAIFALDLATGLLAIIFQERLVANVRLRLANKLRSDYGVHASFTAAIDFIQASYKCCGLEGHLDYDQSLWRLQRLGGFEATVARTCCHLRNDSDDQAHVNPRPANESMCQSTDVRFHQSYRYRRGCLDDLERLIRHKIWTFTIGCGAVGAVILLSLIFATCFCRSIPSNKSRKDSPVVDAASLRQQEAALAYAESNGSNKKRLAGGSHGGHMYR